MTSIVKKRLKTRQIALTVKFPEQFEIPPFPSWHELHFLSTRSAKVSKLYIFSTLLFHCHGHQWCKNRWKVQHELAHVVLHTSQSFLELVQVGVVVTCSSVLFHLVLAAALLFPPFFCCCMQFHIMHDPFSFSRRFVPAQPKASRGLVPSRSDQLPPEHHQHHHRHRQSLRKPERAEYMRAHQHQSQAFLPIRVATRSMILNLKNYIFSDDYYTLAHITSGKTEKRLRCEAEKSFFSQLFREQRSY